jgi:AcrR family transcriptional regulator
MHARADGVDETRQRIIDGARQLFFEHWYDDIRLSSIAEAAGVSHQTVLNHFGSKEGVFAAVAQVVEADIKARGEQVAAGDTATAVRLLLEQYEEMGLANARMVLQEHRVAAVHDVLERGRAVHRAWVESVFAHCLPASGAARRRRVAAFLAATEVMAWKAIRHDYGFSRDDTAEAMAALVRAIEESA